jgi:hypothetical protein
MASPETDRERTVARNIGVGCVTTAAGFFSGGMVGVLVAKIIGSVKSCQPVEGLPACNWYVYAGIGAILGALTLPVLALRRLTRSGPGE